MRTRRTEQHADEVATAPVGRASSARLDGVSAAVLDPAMRSPGAVLELQRLAGNAAVSGLLDGATRSTPSPSVAVQRDLEEQGAVGVDQLHVAEGAGPDLAEGAGSGSFEVAGANEFGEWDGQMQTTVPTHAFRSRGKTGTDQWHHAGGTTGGTGYTPGTSVLVAPHYESAPPKKAGGQATAWIRSSTGTVKVTTHFIGVPRGNNGTAKWAGSGGGLVWIASSAVSRMDRHERGHSGETKKIHDANITPLEKRVGTYRGFGRKTMKAATEADAIAALKTHIDWNASLAAFASADIAMNTPGGTWDTTDQAKADFYHDKGARTIKGTAFGHVIEAP